MPDIRMTAHTEQETTGPAASPVGRLTARLGTTAQRLGDESGGSVPWFPDETARLAQAMLDQTTHNLVRWWQLTEVAVHGWQQVVSELTSHVRHAAEHQATTVTEALNVRPPADWADLHSRFVTERVRAQLHTSGRLAQIAAEVSKQAVQRR